VLFLGIIISPDRKEVVAGHTTHLFDDNIRRCRRGGFQSEDSIEATVRLPGTTLPSAPK
jgi:hypothetical protein